MHRTFPKWNYIGGLREKCYVLFLITRVYCFNYSDPFPDSPLPYFSLTSSPSSPSIISPTLPPFPSTSLPIPFLSLPSISPLTLCFPSPNALLSPFLSLSSLFPLLFFPHFSPIPFLLYLRHSCHLLSLPFSFPFSIYLSSFLMSSSLPFSTFPPLHPLLLFLSFIYNSFLFFPYLLFSSTLLPPLLHYFFFSSFRK